MSQCHISIIENTGFTHNCTLNQALFLQLASPWLTRLPLHVIALKHVPGSERTQLACLQLTGTSLSTLTGALLIP